MVTTTASPRKKTRKALWRVDDGWPKEILIFCPGCKTLEVVRFSDNALIPTRKFAQKAGRVYHDCGARTPCRLHVLHGASDMLADSGVFRPARARPAKTAVARPRRRPVA